MFAKWYRDCYHNRDDICEIFYGLDRDSHAFAIYDAVQNFTGCPTFWDTRI